MFKILTSILIGIVIFLTKIKIISDNSNLLKTKLPTITDIIKKEKVSRGKDIETEQKTKIINTINKYTKGNLTNKGEIFYLAGNKEKVDSILLVSIAILESANGTSMLAQELNNIGGIVWLGDDNVKHQGIWRDFDSVDECIYHLAYIIRRYYLDCGKVTIEQIGSKFCPVSENEGNSEWVPGVTDIYNEIKKDVERMKPFFYKRKERRYKKWINILKN